MAESLLNKTSFATFQVGDQSLNGELRLQGADTSLYLHTSGVQSRYFSVEGTLNGVLQDLTRVTLLKCLTTETGEGGSISERYGYARVFPHFVIEGDHHLDPSVSCISAISFVIPDAQALFYDFYAFGSVIAPEPYIAQIAAANAPDRGVSIGDVPLIAYFTGKLKILAADTALGRIEIRHRPSHTLGGPRGVRIDNTIVISITPEKAITFDDAWKDSFRLLRFLDIAVGRPQNFLSFELTLEGREPHARPLTVHSSHRQSEESGLRGERPHPADLPLDPIGSQDEFIGVMRNWLEGDDTRNDARSQFHRSFRQQRTYFVDRLVASANMFDILPPNAVPADVPLSQDLLNAKLECQRIFSQLPPGIERNSILSALGRLGKASLKHKTRYRAKYVNERVGMRFPELEFVLDQSVDCRNHYVHGAEVKIDYSSHPEVLPFLTDTLEFVFAASEFVEAGWDIESFMKAGTSMSHPFGSYWASYAERLGKLKNLLQTP